MAPQPDGKILIGGNFATINGVSRNRIARLNADGSLDTGFAPGTGADDIVETLALQNDGKVLIGGWFTFINGQSRNRIARLNSDGSVDTSFTPGVAANNVVTTLAQRADGKVLIGGGFTFVYGVSRRNIARLNVDGTLDTSFDPNILTGPSSTVLVLAPQADGKVLIGGEFTLINGQTYNHIARLNGNGSLDNGFNPGNGANSTVYAVAAQPDDKILIGGSFTSVNSTTRNRIARLNANGSIDSSFNPGTGPNNDVSALARQQDGKVLIGGSFTSVNGVTRNRIARLNANGTLDTGFNPSSGADGNVSALIWRQEGRRVLIVGTFTSINGTSRNGIARLLDNGTLDLDYDPGTGANGPVSTLLLQPDGKVLVGGAFTTINGTPRSRIARLNANGSLDTSFDPGTGPNSSVFAMVQQADGKILIGGWFTSVNGITRNHIARLNADGTLDTGFNPGAGGASHIVWTLAQQTDGKVLIGGEFTTFNGTPRNRVARLNANGSLDFTFNPGTGANNIVFALAQQADGMVLIGGDFTAINGVTRNRIARLSLDTAALQTLKIAADGNSATWLRTGASPVLQRVTFEVTADQAGTWYTRNGLRTAGGWKVNGINLPLEQIQYIRARGYYGSGIKNGSGSMVESIHQVYVYPRPDDLLCFPVKATNGNIAIICM